MYIIMEYCEGGDLEKYVEKSGPLTEELIASLLHPIAVFFNKIHQQGIIHRDLKLANILLAKKLVKGEAPQLRITDFGLARTMEIEELAHTTCGTPRYMAPELWGKGNKGYTCEVDVWAFGNMLYKIMYGEYAFDDVNVENRLKQGVIRFPKIRLASLEALDLMIKCLRKNPIIRLKFEEIAEHPFFTKKEFKPFERMFDGYFGFIEINIDNAYDLLADPGCLGIPEKPKQLIDKHNEEVITAWQQTKSLT
jgi:serine/threonine protein kinase